MSSAGRMIEERESPSIGVLMMNCSHQGTFCGIDHDSILSPAAEEFSEDDDECTTKHP